MLGLEHIVAAHLYLANAAVQCQMPQAPQVTVSATGGTVDIDASKRISDLDTYKPNINSSPYAKDIETHIEGLTHSAVRISADYEFGTQTFPSINLACLYVTKINVRIDIKPSIMIAHEYPKGTCHYAAVMAHERKHVAVDREIINRYSNYIAKGVDSALRQVGYVQGPYAADRTQSMQDRTAAVTSSVIQQYGDYMEKERKILQTRVDSLTEYSRVEALCPDKMAPAR